MADWFKFYEDAIDEPRLASAISEMPEVLAVLVLLRSEHCRHKSGSLPWSADEYHMRGLARKINCPVPKFTQALALLMRIKYFSIADGQLTDLCWSELQSDYCQRKTRLQNQQKPDRVRAVSGQGANGVPQEERRGEENRGEKTHTRSGPEINEMVLKLPPLNDAPATRGRRPKDLAECLAMAARVGLVEADAKNWYRDCEALDWKRGDNTPFDYWPRQMTIFRDQLDTRRKAATGGGAGGAADLILRQNELKRVEERMAKIRSSYSEHQDWDQNDRAEWKKLRARKAELVKELGMVV